MPFLSDSLSNGWAVIDVLVGVSQQRRRLLTKHGMAVPQPTHVRALIDTGASISGFAPRVFRELDLSPVASIPILTTSTTHAAPHEGDLYDVSISLVANGNSHPFPDTRVMEADCWHPTEGIEALIGMDILARCFFQIHGPNRQFILSF